MKGEAAGAQEKLHEVLAGQKPVHLLQSGGGPFRVRALCDHLGGKHGHARSSSPLPEMGARNDRVKSRDAQPRVGDVHGQDGEAPCCQGRDAFFHLHLHVVIAEVRKLTDGDRFSRIHDKLGLFDAFQFGQPAGHVI